MAREIFNRQELKFVIDDATFHALLPELRRGLEYDKHNHNGQSYRLHNLYIDTPDSNLIRRSLDKPIYKEKLRIRSYHPFGDDRPVFLEVKKRHKTMTNKRRTKIPFNEALQLIETGQAPVHHDYMNQQVVSELEAMCRTTHYEPKVYITYDRVALTTAAGDDGLRVTFDTNLVAQRYGQKDTVSLLPDNKIIMEMKTLQGIPLWICELLSQYGVYRQGFSKYGSEYHQYLTGRRGVVYA